MKAAVFRGKGKIAIENVPKPHIGEDEILLKIRAVGICGTDLHIYHGGTDVKPGTIIGHEFSGEVAAVGKHVRGWRVGEHAIAEHNVSCAKCYFCLRGKYNLCVKRSVIGLHRPGAFAEYLAIPADLVYRIPRSMPYDVAALVEPLTIALYAAANSGFLLEQKVAVIGQGPIGILLDQVLKAAGARVIGIDVLNHRLAFAKKKGWADTALNSRSRTFQQQFDRLAPLGVDVSFEAVGRAETVDLGLEITRQDGIIHVLGVFEAPATLNMMKLVKKELMLNGSWTCAFSFPAAIDLVHEGKVDLTSLITHRYPFQDVVKAFEDSAAYKGNRMKTVVTIP
ncbi:MAG: alcohol dehydrogenase catalytic domain-containing protein [Candidatus Kerfeldbacteria bacterium]|nr:alcohol dehydrogenase catalytic domain-containing protein [Candidatus Kerfeldbacteria bacterium]